MISVPKKGSLPEKEIKLNNQLIGTIRLKINIRWQVNIFLLREIIRCIVQQELLFEFHSKWFIEGWLWKKKKKNWGRMFILKLLLFDKKVPMNQCISATIV